jgi:alpha-mannosidase
LKYEVPLHGWMDVTNPAKDFGAAILNDCKYGSDKPTDNTLRLTLLYTPGVRGGYQHQGTQDWGHHEMTYALEGHLGNVGIPTQWDSIELNQPLLSFQDAVDNEHPGPRGKTFSLVGLTDNRVQIEALKQAEKSDAIIVRFNELSGVTDRAIHVKFASPVLSAVEVDGQERPIGPATIEGGELVFSTTGYRPHSYAVHIAPIKKPLTPPAGRPIALPFNLDGISMWDRKTYGNFDGAGNTLPGELLPKTILSGGVRFDLGPTGPGQKNVLIPQGQTIPLPNARNKHLSFLMTAVGGDITEADLQDEKRWFRIYARDLHGTYPLWLPVQSWDGYIGQWDNRLWAGKVPELTYDWNNPLAGLQPGFIKRDTVAWYADHRRLADGTNDIYKFCYLYRYDIRLMGDVTSIKLPDDPRLRILAATLSDNPNDDTYPAQPLYDVIDHRENSAPGIGLHSVTGAEVTANQRFDNSVVVTFSRPEYWSDAQSLRYTLDGSQPRPNSPAATGDIYVNRTATIQVAQFDGSRQTSPVAAVHLDILDTTPPAVESAVAVPYDPAVRIKFSKPVDTLGASSPLRYVVNAGGVLPVTAATLSEDGRTVTLSLNKPILAEYAGHITLSLQGIADRSPARNALSASGVPVEMLKPAFVFPGPQAFDGRRGVTQREVPNLPAKAGDAWTLNFFIHPDAAPQDLTILAGFGSGGDDHGAQRYFVVQDNGVEFWGSDIDIPAGQNVDVGKWQMWTASYDGKTLRIYKDGVEQKSQPVVLQDAAATVRLAPPPAWRNGHRFTGQIAALTIWTRALPPAAIAALAATGPPH